MSRGLQGVEVGGVRQFGEGLPGGTGDPELCAGLVDGGELVGRRESPVEELQGLLGCGQ